MKYFALMILSLSGLCPSMPEAIASKHPNFLVIMVDDLNDWIGPLGGHPQAHTPNLDRLAERGVTFTNAHCSAPLCGPSRASLWTGRAPSTTGIYFHIEDEKIMDNLPEGVEAKFLPDVLEASGYYTLAAGKLFHKGDSANTFQEHGPKHSFGPWPENGLRFNFEPKWLGQGGTSTDWAAYPESDEQMPDTAISNWAVGKLTGTLEQPYFMGVGFARPHVPWYVPKHWFDLFEEKDMKTPPYLPGDYDDVPQIASQLQATPAYPTTEWAIAAGEWQAIVQAYLACVAYVDSQIGKVLDALEETEYADNTVIILVGDHGYHLGEKNRFAKMALWERSTKTPLIIAGPGITEGIKCNASVSLIDIYPTILELAGTHAVTPLEGYSLVPLLKNPDSDWGHAAVSTYGRNNHAVRTHDYRYIQYENGDEELYDHRSDPWEHDNLASDPKQAPVIEELKQFLPKTNAPLAADSSFGINPYLRERTPVWREE